MENGDITKQDIDIAPDGARWSWLGLFGITTHLLFCFHLHFIFLSRMLLLILNVNKGKPLSFYGLKCTCNMPLGGYLIQAHRLFSEFHTHSLRITHISAWSMYVEAHKRMNKLLNNDFEYAMSENSPYANVDVRTVNGYFWRCIDQKNICAFIMFEWRYNIEIYVRCALSNVQRYYFYGMSIEHVCLRFL